MSSVNTPGSLIRGCVYFCPDVFHFSKFKGAVCIKILALLTMNEGFGYVMLLCCIYFQMVIHRYKDIGRLGTMHLVATNLCIWIRLLVMEEFAVIQEVEEK